MLFQALLTGLGLCCWAWQSYEAQDHRQRLVQTGGKCQHSDFINSLADLWDKYSTLVYFMWDWRRLSVNAINQLTFAVQDLNLDNTHPSILTLVTVHCYCSVSLRFLRHMFCKMGCNIDYSFTIKMEFSMLHEIETPWRNLYGNYFIQYSESQYIVEEI